MSASLILVQLPLNTVCERTPRVIAPCTAMTGPALFATKGLPLLYERGTPYGEKLLEVEGLGDVAGEDEVGRGVLRGGLEVADNDLAALEVADQTSRGIHHQ